MSSRPFACTVKRHGEPITVHKAGCPALTGSDRINSLTAAQARSIVAGRGKACQRCRPSLDATTYARGPAAGPTTRGSNGCPWPQCPVVTQGGLDGLDAHLRVVHDGRRP